MGGITVMFDKLIDTMVEFIGLFQCWTYIDEYEKGVILRLGRFSRVVDPGPRYLLPMGIDRVLTVNAMPDPIYLDLQSVHTKDDYKVNIQVGVIWEVTDPKAFLIDNENTEHMIRMLCSGVVLEKAQQTSWAAAREEGFADTLRTPMNRKIKKRGARITDVVIQDFTAGDASRLWHEGIHVSLNS